MFLSSRCGGPSPTNEGFVVVAVLWIVGMLAALAGTYSVYVIDVAVAMSLNGRRLQAEALVRAGLELAALRIRSDRNVLPVLGQFKLQLGEANLDVAFR